MKQIAFGKYTLLRRLARGGMAELYLARSSGVANVQRMVVIKLVASRFAEDESFVTMFQDEVRIAAMLNHPGIGQVYEVGEVSGNLYLAMEFLHGQDLRASVRQSLKRRKEPVPVAVAAMVGAKVCSALEYAHNVRTLDGQKLGIIHRDLSPSNIMLTYDGNVKLVDFGIAKAANRISLTQPGLIKGKVRYLSPEQVLGNQVDHRCDIFTLGTSLWEATIGRHLFEGKRDIQIYEQISKGQVRLPSSMRPDYPKQLEHVLMKALARDPDHRYPTARAMQADLEQFAVDLGVPLSDIALSRYMHELFADEMTAWQRAQQAGHSLLQHMLDITPADDLTRDLEAALSHEDQRLTRPAKDHERPSSARGSFSAPLPQPPPDDSEERPTRIEIPDRRPPDRKPPPSSPIKATPKATPSSSGDRPSGERKTVMFGELNASDMNYQNPAAPAKPQASSVGPITLGRRSKPPTGAHAAISRPVGKPLKKRETSDLVTSATPTASPDAQRRAPSNPANVAVGRGSQPGPPDSGSFPRTGPRQARPVTSDSPTIGPDPDTAPSLDDIRQAVTPQAKTLIASAEDHEPADSNRPTMIDSLLRGDSSEQTGVLKAGPTAVPDPAHAYANMARPRQAQSTGQRRPMSTGPSQPLPSGPAKTLGPSQPLPNQPLPNQPLPNQPLPVLQQPGHAAPPHAVMQQQPQVVQPHVAQPQAVQPQAVQPQVVRPQVVQPQIGQPRMGQPQWQPPDDQGPGHPFGGGDHQQQPAPIQPVASREPVILGRDPHGTAMTQAQPQQERGPTGADGQAEGEVSAEGGEKKKKTGDWSHQQTNKEEQRPGTHPYFKEEGRTLIGDQRMMPPGRRPRSKAPLIGLVIFLLLVGGGIGVYFGVFYNAGDGDDDGSGVGGSGTGSAAGAVKGSGKAGSAQGSAAKGTAAGSAVEDKDAVRITSTPSGAMVFRAETGEELGKTPMSLSRKKLGDGRIEVYLKGYKTRRVTIRHDVTAKTIKLKKGNAGRRPRRKGGKSAAPRRPKKGGGNEDILDPFKKK
ncbi:MAG: protein kinase [Myxococcales bacterium]|nr:protein kinase [Myxococcales bacterium]